MYSPLVIAEIWIFTVIMALVTVTGLLLLRDWLYANFGVYGRVYVPTPSWFGTVHIVSAISLLALGLIHIILHIRSGRTALLPVDTRRDFHSFLHSGLYLIGLSRREVRRTRGKFNGRQRITYMALIYIAGLAALTGVLYYAGVLGHSLALVHIIPGGLTFMVVLFHFLMFVKNHDKLALKAAFFTGKLPLWYVRRNKPLWYEELELPTPEPSPEAGAVGGDELTEAVAKFARLVDARADKDIVGTTAQRIRSSLDREERERLLELAAEI